MAEESERIFFGKNRRRAYGLDLSKTDLVSPDDFPQERNDDGDYRSLYSD